MKETSYNPLYSHAATSDHAAAAAQSVHHIGRDTGTMPPAEPAISTIAEFFDETGAIAREYFYAQVGELATADKGGATGFDPVTVADRRIEAVLRVAIAERWPRDMIVGEEDGISGEIGAARRWFIDPIDGTKAFLTGMAGWGTLLGVVEDGRAVAGWMDQPVLGELFSAVDNQAHVMRRPGFGGITGAAVVEPLHTSSCTALDEAIMYTTHPSMFVGAQRRAYDDLGERVRLQRFGGDCYAYCQLARGRVDLVVESDLKAHDIVALIPIVEAAGGVVWGMDRQQPLQGGTVVAAANAELAEQALAVLEQ